VPKSLETVLKRSSIFLIVVTLFLFGLGQLTQAHPHAWIDLRAEVKLDDQGRITAVDVEWTFDPYYTVFTLEGILKDGLALQPALNALARENLKNLREYDYFLDIRADGVKMKTREVSDFQTEMRGERLWMRFEAPLETPIDPKALPVSVSSYDPTFYIEVLYVEEGLPVTFKDSSGGAVTGSCFAEIVKPTPTMEDSLFAASLGPNEDGGTSLGEIFAEKAILTCK
jgi:ABC-type uncharacterized transport system substrate-binding protein